MSAATAAAGGTILPGMSATHFQPEVAMAIPKKDSDLASFGSNFSTRITATPASFGVSASDATQYSSLLTAFTTAYNAVVAAREAGSRSKSLTTTKDDAKREFLSFARDLYSTVQADTS